MSPEWKKSSLLLVLTLSLPVLGLISLMLAAGANQLHTPPSQANIQEVEVMRVSLQTSYHYQKLAYGRVEAAKQAKVGFELAGTLIDVWVDEGDDVSKGQRLARLDTQRLDARMAELTAGLKRASADARLARLSERRVAALIEQNLESAQRLDELREASLATEARVLEIQAMQDSLQVELQKSVLSAPFDGAILSRPVDPGTVVAAGQMVLSMQESGKLQVRIALPADEGLALRANERHLLLDSQRRKVAAQVKSVAKQRKLDTRTLDVLFTLPDKPDGVLVGDLLAFSYAREMPESGAWVPSQALSNGIRGLWTLYTVVGTGEQQIVPKTVEVLYAEPDRVYVRGAIKEQDLVVIAGGHRLVPDQQVNARIGQFEQLAGH